jgi:hypothetical protein
MIQGKKRRNCRKLECLHTSTHVIKYKEKMGKDGKKE